MFNFYTYDQNVKKMKKKQRDDFYESIANQNFRDPPGVLPDHSSDEEDEVNKLVMVSPERKIAKRRK